MVLYFALFFSLDYLTHSLVSVHCIMTFIFLRAPHWTYIASSRIKYKEDGLSFIMLTCRRNCSESCDSISCWLFLQEGIS
ncbi:hypothetical protein M405DRAFT_407366 [Rhizopogon salebrosus TDB-379]|nr:hypothetical protein M405DRAFT_407366 [Rhizopogon salebrosus TDB-379]